MGAAPITGERALRGHSPLIIIIPFPLGEGDYGDGATTTKQGVRSLSPSRKTGKDYRAWAIRNINIVL
jgi:hypothetical protein